MDALLGIDLNRAFDGPAPPAEVSLMRPHLDAREGRRPFDLSVDLHEDVDNDLKYEGHGRVTVALGRSS